MVDREYTKKNTPQVRLVTEKSERNLEREEQLGKAKREKE